MTVFSQGPRSWLLKCDGFDSDTFDRCESQRVLSKFSHSFAEAMRNEDEEGWKNDPIFGKHYCAKHKISETS